MIAAPKTLLIQMGSRWQSEESQDQQSDDAKAEQQNGFSVHDLHLRLERISKKGLKSQRMTLRAFVTKGRQAPGNGVC